MQLRTTLILAAPLAAIVACGGSTSTGTGSVALTAATPSYATISLDQTTADTSPPTTALVASSPTQMAGPGGGCHPHLFMREREVVERVNRHIYKVLGKIERLVASSPTAATGSSQTWTRTENGVDLAFTVTLTAPSTYAWEFDAGPTGTTPLPVVMTGTIDRSTATGPHQGIGTLEVDFAKLNAAFPQEHVSGGTMQVWFAVSATSRKITVLADQVTWDLDPMRFDGDVVPAGLLQPRSGAYVYFREPGKGGSLKVQDEMSFACAMDPRIDNASLVPSNAQLISRWYRAGDGTVHGRSDGLLTGGPITGTAVARIVGVTCHDAAAEQRMPTEGFWLVKAEDSAGATLVGASSQTMMDTSATPCDPAFGPVPSLADDTQDFAGWPTPDPASPINPFYSDDEPFPFPGM